MSLRKPVFPWIPASFFVLLLLTGFADDDTRYRRIKDALDKFTYVYQQQKVYLHIDKESYAGGETVYVKAYLLNGMNHLPDTLSTNLYVELISPFLTRVEMKRFQMFNGFGIGDFRLSDTLPEGLYQIRAYTNWMLNFDPDYFFEKNFPVINPAYSKLISPRQAKENQKQIENREKLADDFDIQFMPEGGNMVEGIESTVAFKAINQLGRGVDVEGVISDEKGQTVTTFRSLFRGMGRFNMTPGKGKKYFAMIQGGKGGPRIVLPEPLETGTVMSAKNTVDNIEVTLLSNKSKSSDRTANEVILVGQVGGKIYYHDILSLEDGKASATIKKVHFPSGIIQLTAFTGRGLPFAERLLYNNRYDNMKIAFSATDSISDDGTRLLIHIFTSDKRKDPLPANLSLSLTREKSTSHEVNNDNIVSNILLSSDLKGYIEDPYNYFSDNAPFMQEALDNLMLTNGWRRFDWSGILAGEYPEINYHEERGIAIYGQITRDFFNLPLKNIKVQLSVLSSYNDVFTQNSSDKGYFLFDNLVYYDTVSVKIEAWRQNGRRNLLIVLPDEKKNEVSSFQGDFSLITESERDKKVFRQEKGIKSKEALEKEKQRLEEERKDQLHGLYAEPDYVIYSEDIPKGNHNAIEVLKGRVPGLNITGDNVLIRGPNTIFGSNEPLYLVDGMPVHDVEAINSIPVEDIERIEVVKGPSTSIYGMQGANGVIAVFTKRGHYVKRGVIEFDMLGYTRARQFYQPKYTPENEPRLNYTVYWTPVINTGPTGRATILLDKPQVTGEYRLVIEGVSYEGHVGGVNEVISNE